MPTTLKATCDNQARLRRAKTGRGEIAIADVRFPHLTETNLGLTLASSVGYTNGVLAFVQPSQGWTLYVSGSTAPTVGPEKNFEVEALEPNPERAWFLRMKDQLKDQYEGRYVAIHEGRVVDSDPDAAALLDRFCETFGEEVSVYFGFVGEEPELIVPGVDSIP